MAALGRLRKPRNSLSVSLPNVNYSDHQQAHAQMQQLSPLTDSPFLPTPTKTADNSYNIDDDAWADRVDPVTGSVFYVEPNLSSHSSLVPSSSSSSLSSSPSISEFIPPMSPQKVASPKHSNASLPERFSSSVQVLPESPMSLDDHTLFPGPSSSGSFYTEKTQSFRKKLQKLVTPSMSRKLNKRQQLQSGSLSDLNLLHSEYNSHFSELVPQPKIPQGSQYGSHGTPLNMPTSPLVGYRFKVEIDLSQFQLGVENMTCSLEKLGIVPAKSMEREKFSSLVSLQFSFKTRFPLVKHAKPVVIKGIVPGSPAAVTQLKPGDTIITVNQHNVNMENVDSVLATLSNKIHFLIKKGHAYSRDTTISQDHSLLSPPPHAPSSGGLVRLVTGGRGLGRPHPRKQHRHLHMLLYITLDTNENDPPEKDILFRYPRVSEDEGGGAKTLENLVRLRGVFLTLSDTLASITGSLSVCNSSLVLNGDLVHLSYTQQGKELLLIALPAQIVSQYQLQLLLESVVRVIRLMFESLHSAFTSSNHSFTIEHLLDLIFDMILSDGSPKPSSSLLGVPAIPRLKLPIDVAIKLDASLSDLESADHSNRPEMLHVQRPFLLVGSCLMHRGCLACNHLSPSDFCDVVLYCHAYRLLELTSTESISQIVIWRELYLSSMISEGDEDDLVYHVDHRQRTFLLITGLEQMLLCMLLQQTTPPPSPQGGSCPSVDAVYVDRGRSLLLELRAQDFLNQDLGETSPFPSLLSADIALASLFTHSSKQPTSHHNSPISSRTRKLSDPLFGIRFGSTRSLSTTEGVAAASDSDDDDAIAGPLRSHSVIYLKPSFRKRKFQHLYSNLYTGDTEKGYKRTIKSTRPAHTLTTGLDNLLLHYINLEPGRGLMLCPTHSMPPGPIHLELLQCFQHACCSIRGLLREKEVAGDDGGVESVSDDLGSDEEVEDGSSMENEASPNPFTPLLSSVFEHGIMLDCSAQSLRTTAALRYWVIGRYFSEAGRELYVCCQENISQSTVEMAFKLLFGWPG